MKRLIRRRRRLPRHALPTYPMGTVEVEIAKITGGKNARIEVVVTRRLSDGQPTLVEMKTLEVEDTMVLPWVSVIKFQDLPTVESIDLSSLQFEREV